VKSQRLQKVERFLLFGVIAIPLVITPSLAIDAINVGKFMLLFFLGTVSFYFSLVFLRWKRWPREIMILLFFLVLGLILPLVFSGSNFDQQLFGVWGRNIGLFTHLSSFLIFVWAALIAQRKELNINLSFYFSVVSAISLCYGFAQSLGFDFVPWNPPQIFGTLGNTNFYGAHTAIIFSMALGFFTLSKPTRKQKIFLTLILIGSLFLTLRTEAFQGVVIIAITSSIAGHIWLRKVGLVKTAHSYLAFSLLFASLGLLGLIGLGPMVGLLESETTTLRFRFYFWQAAIKMFMSNPIYGVGLDSYGDWYRVSRSDSAYFGGDVGESADSAHNLLLDYAATGGVLLFIFGLLLLALSTKSALSILYFKNSSSDNSALAPYSLGFIGFLIQSMVSPISIGLLVWGFLLAGLVFGRNIEFKERNLSQKFMRTRTDSRFTAIYALLVFLSFTLAIMPISKEYRILRAQKSENSINLVNSLAAFPRSAYLYREGVSILENARYYGPATKLALRGVQDFPRDYRLLYLVTKLSAIDSETKKALQIQLDEIDPPRLLDKS
jgi:O-antigen ligase